MTSNWCVRSAFALLCLTAMTCIAQPYPARPVRLVVASAPAGGSDMLARIVAEGLTEKWQRPVVIDNRVGGGGTVATDIVVKAAPDGYTLLVQSFGISYVSALRRNLPFDVARDIVPIVRLASQPFLLAAHPTMPANTVSELIAYARKNPRQLNYGTSGAGGASHLGTELFGAVANIELVPVNYKGTGPAASALISGEIQMLLAGVSTVVGHVKANRIKALGVTSLTRSALLPDVPAIAEALPGFEFDVWYGIFGPANLPRDLVRTVNATVNDVLRQPAVRERVAAIGAIPGEGSEEDFRRFFQGEMKKWREVIERAGIKAD
jgi:tripartite-type tricarboxylate transporter receptor subunit TctC